MLFEFSTNFRRSCNKTAHYFRIKKIPVYDGIFYNIVFNCIIKKFFKKCFKIAGICAEFKIRNCGCLCIIFESVKSKKFKKTVLSVNNVIFFYKACFKTVSCKCIYIFVDTHDSDIIEKFIL